MVFLTKSTRINCIVATSIIAVLLLTLVMVSTLIDVSYQTKVLLGFIYAIGVLVITLFWQGILQLKVFSDYKCQNKLLCADGVISIVIGVLLLICSILFGIFQLENVIQHELVIGADIRIFLIVFLGVLALWRLAMCIVSLVKKQFNSWYNLGICVGWLGLTILCGISLLNVSMEFIAWLSMSFSWLATIFYLIFLIHTYAISNPTYLETEQAMKILEKEQEDQKLEEEALRTKILTKATSAQDLAKKVPINEKLKKLREVHNLGLISDSEYERKKESLLSEI